jgi:hypothetical protein
MRRTELARTEFKRTMPTEPKPAKGPRPKKCAVCSISFKPDRMGQRVCSPACAQAYAKAVSAAQERKADRVRKQALKTRQDHMADAQRAFNAFIRERDKDQPCICCGRTGHKVQGLHSHGWDCGHFRSVGSAPHMRFVEDNANRQLVYCNRDRAGRAVDYRIGLIARIGLARVEALEADQTPRKWTIEELQAIKAIYRAKLKSLKESA